MNEQPHQASFFERVRRRRRTKSKPDDLAQKFTPLAEWYRVNNPSIKSLRVHSDDIWSIREYWKTNEIQCRQSGFVLDGMDINWRGFDLVEGE